MSRVCPDYLKLKFMFLTVTKYMSLYHLHCVSCNKVSKKGYTDLNMQKRYTSIIKRNRNKKELKRRECKDT